MFADWTMFKNLNMDVDLWVNCANGSLTKVLGVGDVGILRKVLLVPQLKKDLISEGQLAREMEWTIMAKGGFKKSLVKLESCLWRDSYWMTATSM